MPRGTKRSAEEWLSDKVHCAEDMKALVSKEGISKAEKLVKKVKRVDPDIVIEIVDDDLLHAAVGMNGSPVIQGEDSSISKTNFKQWVAGQALDVAPTCVVDATELVFHRLADYEAINIIYGRYHLQAWENSLTQNQNNFARVFLENPRGHEAVHMYICPNVFGYHS